MVATTMSVIAVLLLFNVGEANAQISAQSKSKKVASAKRQTQPREIVSVETWLVRTKKNSQVSLEEWQNLGRSDIAKKFAAIGMDVENYSFPSMTGHRTKINLSSQTPIIEGMSTTRGKTYRNARTVSVGTAAYFTVTKSNEGFLLEYEFQKSFTEPSETILAETENDKIYGTRIGQLTVESIVACPKGQSRVISLSSGGDHWLAGFIVD